MNKKCLYIRKECTEIIKEFDKYSYPEDSGKAKHMRISDHEMDRVCYFIVNWQRGYIENHDAKRK